jgi:hypothetical protein
MIRISRAHRFYELAIPAVEALYSCPFKPAGPNVGKSRMKMRAAGVARETERSNLADDKNVKTDFQACCWS